MVGKTLENNVSQVNNTSGSTLPEGNANIPGIRVPGELFKHANTAVSSDVVNQEVSFPVYHNVANNETMVGNNLDNNISQVHNTSGMILPEGNALVSEYQGKYLKMQTLQRHQMLLIRK